MRTVPKQEFLALAAPHGLGVDPAYIEHWPRNLGFVQPTSQRRYWCPPAHPKDIVGFLNDLLNELGRWQTMYLWSKAAPFGPYLPNEDNSVLTYLAAQMPALDSDGATAFDRADHDALVTLVFALISLGWNCATDVYLVPDSFDACLMVDHHDAVHAEFPTAERCRAYIEGLRGRGITFPDAPPDGTFTRNPDGSLSE
jgi:hypothetical protein